MNQVFVLDTRCKPLTPCHPARARALLKNGKAAVFRRIPFTIVLKTAIPDAVVKPLTVKIDPGSKITGLALAEGNGRIVFGAELEHRGTAIKARLDSRRTSRRLRRHRKTRYRAARFNNRMRTEGWLPPSLQHRVETTMTWVNRFRQWANIEGIAVERVKFDMQLMQNPEISGVEYQQGTLQGYSVREYLLEKWGRKCAYCATENVPLQVEHVKARANGGSNNVSNLTLACEPCNSKKGTKDIAVFLQKKPDVLKRIMAQIKKPLTDAAAVNTTRNKLFTELLKTGLPVETGTGAQTKFNRTRLNYPKAHWIDAACVGDSATTVTLNPELKPLLIKATGHGTRQMVSMDKYGFPRTQAKSGKMVNGIQTGDLVKIIQPKGKYVGRYVARVSSIKTVNQYLSIPVNGVPVGFPSKLATLIQKADGYAYA
ncbi:MAG: HNH endonuclease [Methylomicrobium sp.]|nr:HNH endonuclease [Methylomicrobium sp.]